MSFSVIVPSRNTDNLIQCIEAVRAHETSCRVLIVDDGIDTQRLIGRVWGPTILIQGVKPFIFSRNCNIGIRAADNGDVILLNDDALLTTPGGFTALAAVAAEHPEYGVIAAACDNVGNRNQFPKGVGLREDPRMVCFVCVYIPRKTIEKVGLLDERYVGYGMDDDDYCFSVRKAGLKVGIFDHCIVDHRSLTSSYRGNPRAPSDFRPNMKLFIDKWGHDNWGFPRDVALRRWGLA